MKLRLKKDIVIPAGTVFNDAPLKVVRKPGCYVESVIGLTPDAVGFFTCDTDCGDEWFEKVGK
jgi:hypothetical protein